MNEDEKHGLGASEDPRQACTRPSPSDPLVDEMESSVLDPVRV